MILVFIKFFPYNMLPDVFQLLHPDRFY
uniref:RR10 n=1 Tax=Arundo donax TaxID=35708 RepID=A0A0A9JWK2_ARUDO